MKQLIIAVIDIYQNFFSVLIRQMIGIPHVCRFTPTCSEYAKISISQKGLLTGSFLSISRIIKCQPFYSPKHESVFNKGVKA